MSPIAFEIYGFTKKFLKLNSRKLSLGDRFVLIFIIVGMLSYIIFLKTFNSDEVLAKSLSGIALSISIVYFIWYARKITEENEAKNFLTIHKEKYVDFTRDFELKYGDSYGKKIEEYLKHTVEELKRDIDLQIEKSKYKFDKTLTVLTLSPALSVIFSLGQGSQDRQYDINALYLIIIGMGILLVVVNISTIQIYSPIFNVYSDLEKKQEVYAFLTGYLIMDVSAILKNSDKKDFRHQRDQQVFGVRATALIVRDHKIYLNRDRQGRYYTIGGAIRIGETTKEAVKREVKEEIGLAIEIESLAFVVENSFCQDGVNFHNIEFHYVVKPVGEPNGEMVEDREKRPCEWVDLERLSNINLVPAFLKTELTNLSTAVKHIVIMEDRED